MRYSSSTSSNSTWTTSLKYTALILMILVSGCARKANLIPFGFGEVFDDPARASSAARVDYHLLYTMQPKDPSITFRVTENGERVWPFHLAFWKGEGFVNHEFWDRPFWKSIKWYQVSLFTPGPGDAICVTDPKHPDSKTDVTEIKCKFAKGTAGDYFDRPLIALLEYYGNGQEDTPPGKDEVPTQALGRTLFIIPDKH